MAKQEKKITMSFRVLESLHRQVRVLAGAEGRPIESVMHDALKAWVAGARMDDALSDLSARREARR